MNGEILTKSHERVKKFAEIYTPMWLVKKMCDMLGEENPDAWTVLENTFLEPACGNGNFLVEIFERKLKLCSNAGDGLIALRSIYGIDILLDNVEESRQRLFDMFVNAFPTATLADITAAEMILEQNIICGDSLKIMKKWAEEEDEKRERSDIQDPINYMIILNLRNARFAGNALQWWLIRTEIGKSIR